MVGYRPSDHFSVPGVHDHRQVHLSPLGGVVGVGSDRGALPAFSAGGFPRPALRTGRATSTASGSLCVHSILVQLCLYHTYPPLGSERSGHGVPVFTSDLRDHSVAANTPLSNAVRFMLFSSRAVRVASMSSRRPRGPGSIPSTPVSADDCRNRSVPSRRLPKLNVV